MKILAPVLVTTFTLGATAYGAPGAPLGAGMGMGGGMQQGQMNPYMQGQFMQAEAKQKAAAEIAAVDRNISETRGKIAAATKVVGEMKEKLHTLIEEINHTVTKKRNSLSTERAPKSAGAPESTPSPLAISNLMLAAFSIVADSVDTLVTGTSEDVLKQVKAKLEKDLSTEIVRAGSAARAAAKPSDPKKMKQNVEKTFSEIYTAEYSKPDKVGQTAETKKHSDALRIAGIFPQFKPGTNPPNMEQADLRQLTTTEGHEGE